MRASWLGLIDSVLRPQRPNLERCLREREHHLAARRLFAQRRAHAIADCEGRIESARAAVFAANDGVVALRMTELEREWRRLSRPDPDAGLMDLWARIAPATWIDRKRWRDSDGREQLDAAVMLAADVEGVEAAESAIRSLGGSLAAWGARISTRVRWRSFERDSDCTTELLTEPLRAAVEAVSASDERTAVLERAQHLERDVQEAMRAQWPDRPMLARGVAHAAYVDFVWRAAALGDRPNPVASLRELWKTGYVLSAVDESGVTLEM